LAPLDVALAAILLLAPLVRHLPGFVSLFKEVDLTSEAEGVHDGYFSIDKARRWTDTADNNQASRDNAERA
jgi:type III restriction enzyme